MLTYISTYPGSETAFVKKSMIKQKWCLTMETNGRKSELIDFKYEIYKAARDGQVSRILNLLRDPDRKTAIQSCLNHYTDENGQNITPLIIAARNGKEIVVWSMVYLQSSTSSYYCGCFGSAGSLLKSSKR